MSVPHRLVDLSHEVGDGVVTYPGLPAPVIDDHLSFDDSRDHYAAGTEFRIGRIQMVANTGTYLDTPAHRFRDGFDLAELPLASVADLPGRLVDASHAASSSSAARTSAPARASASAASHRASTSSRSSSVIARARS